MSSGFCDQDPRSWPWSILLKPTQAQLWSFRDFLRGFAVCSASPSITGLTVQGEETETRGKQRVVRGKAEGQCGCFCCLVISPKLHLGPFTFLWRGALLSDLALHRCKWDRDRHLTGTQWMFVNDRHNVWALPWPGYRNIDYMLLTMSSEAPKW